MSRTPLTLLLIFLFVGCGLPFVFDNPVAGHFSLSGHRATISATPRPAFASTLIINEYLADPPAIGGDANGDGTVSSSQDEFIELINSGSEPVDVSGYAVVVGTTTRFTFPSATIIPGGEASVIFGGGTPIGPFGNARALGLIFTASLGLVNSGTTITIRDSLGMTSDSLAYGSAEGNADQSITRSPDITGSFVKHSLAPGASGRLFSPGTRVDGSTFSPPVPVLSSITPDGTVAGSEAVQISIAGAHFESASQAIFDGSPVPTTFISSIELNAEIPASFISFAGAHSVAVHNPGSVASNVLTFTVLGSVGINELLADPPDGPEGDANGDGIRDSADDEFIELVNRTDSPIDVGGFSVSDADQRRFNFPKGTIIPAQEVAVIFGGGHPKGDFGNAAINELVFTAPLSLNNTSETITLRDPGGVFVEVVSYGVEGGQNESLNRSPESVGTAFVRHSSIAGAGGKRFSPGTRADGTSFTIAPRIGSISPDQVPLGAAAFDLTVVGHDFDANCVVMIDSLPVAARFDDSAMLTAEVPTRITNLPGKHRVFVRNPDGNRSNQEELVVVPPPPTLSSVVPRFIPLDSPAATLFALGRGFDSGAKVLIDGVRVSTSFLSPTSLSFLMPSSFVSSLGQRKIRVRNGDGQESGDYPVEVVRPFVRITSVSPSEVNVGEGEFALSITGQNFTEGAVAFLDLTPLPTMFLSPTQLKAVVAPELVATARLRAVSVQNVDGFFSNEIAFWVRPEPPIIRNIDPPSVSEGSGDLKLTITGQEFQRGAYVRIKESDGSSAILEADFKDSSRLETILPASFLERAHNIPLRVENPDLGASNEVVFTVLIRDPLVINEYLADPPDGPAGDANGDGTRSSSQDEFVEILNRTTGAIDLSGYRISDAESVRHVFAPGTIVPAGEAVVVFGGGAPRGNFGNAADNNLVFKASSGGLSLNNGGDVIRLEDKDGVLIQEIGFTGVEGGAGQSLNRNPDGDGAVFSLHSSVSNGSGKLFSPGAKATGDPFTTRPSIDSLEPASVHAGAPGFTLSISGREFLQGAVVLFGDAELPTAIQSSNGLEARVDELLLVEPGAVAVRVRNPKGELSLPKSFLVVGEPPSITRMIPDHAGTGSPEFEVSIDGANFQRRALVLVNNEPVQAKVSSENTLAFEMPLKFLSTAALLDIRVRNEDGNESNGLAFTVENGPLITRLSRSRIRAGRGDVEITIGGVSFKPGIELFIGDVGVVTRFLSEVELTAVIPAEFSATPGTLTLQARNVDGGRSNLVRLRVVE